MERLEIYPECHLEDIPDSLFDKELHFDALPQKSKGLEVEKNHIQDLEDLFGSTWLL